MLRDELYSRLYQDLCLAPVIDTHEHLPSRESMRCQDCDVLSEYTSHYISSDLVSAGLSPADLEYVRDFTQPLEKRWRTAEPYWQACRYTGYARALDLSVRAIYGIDGIQRHTIVPLNDKFRQMRQPGHFRHVIRDLCNIECCIDDAFSDDLTESEQNSESVLFRRAWRPDAYFLRCPPLSRMDAKAHSIIGGSFRDLQSYLDLLDHQLAALQKKNVYILKIGTAYERSLAFAEVTDADAHRYMASFLADARKKPDQDHILPVPLQDYMLHQILKRADQQNLIVQIHTGLQEGNGNILANSQPLLLTNLLLKYPNAHFDLFHIGYPFIGETCALAKNFANVSIDMCWSHIIAPVAARRALSEFIDAVPANKISAFGGDYLFVDGIYGHLQLARENVAAVLAEKVRGNVMAEDQAVLLGRQLFYDNPRRIFRLSL